MKKALKESFKMNLFLLICSIVKIAMAIFAIMWKHPGPSKIINWLKIMVFYEICYSILQLINIHLLKKADFLEARVDEENGEVYYNLSSTLHQLSTTNSNNPQNQGISYNEINLEIFRKHKVYAAISTILKV